MNIHNIRNKEEADLRRECAYQEWLIEKKHIKQIALKYGTDPTKFKKYIISKGHSLDTANYHIFDNIDNEEKAYWLGFLFADGYVSLTTNLIELSLQLNDETHLEKFKSFMNAQQNITKDSFRCRIVISNKHLKQTLINLGCTSQKSNTIKFPKINRELYPHFIRGYFDGDGCISKTFSSFLWNTASIASGSISFITDLKEILENIGMNQLVIYKKSKSNVWYIGFIGQNFNKFFSYTYSNSNIYLDRKFNRINNSIAVFSRNGE